MKNILIALRNLNRQKKRSFLLGGAIAFGILIITLINGFAGSFVDNVNENFSHLVGGQVFIDGFEKSQSGRRISVIRDDSALMKAISQSGIKTTFITKASNFSGTLIFQNNTAAQQVVGTDWQKGNYITSRLTLIKGDFAGMRNPHGIIISDRVARKL